MRSIRVTALVPIVLMPLTLIPVSPSTAGSVNTRLDCPRRVEVGEFARLDLHLENQLCSALSVRVISTLVGNGEETAGDVAILGPAVAARDVDVPAATDLLPGVCIKNQCTDSFVFCTSDMDCVCHSVTVGVADVEIVVPTAIPPAFDGTVVNQFIFTDYTDVMTGTNTISDSCLIPVPEPRAAVQWAAALVILIFLRQWANHAQNQKENAS